MGIPLRLTAKNTFNSVSWLGSNNLLTNYPSDNTCYYKASTTDYSRGGLPDPFPVLSFVIMPVRGDILGVATRFIPSRKALGQQEPNASHVKAASTYRWRHSTVILCHYSS